jgi:uncharacterized repeat protein (TIGR03803 family)
MLRMSGSGVLALALALLLAVIGTTRRVEAQSETVLHFFAGAPADGAAPFAGLIRDSAGNFYGITESGGPSRNCFAVPPGGCGVVFKIDSTGKETVLYSFKGGTTDGANPVASRLIRDSSGNFYGTTSGGGTSGKGVVFKLALTGKETVLHNFKGGTTDGAVPTAGLIRDSAGNLYGTTLYGGASHKGVVFKLALTGKETVLHSFKGAPTDGENPAARLIRDSSGNFYGTTQAGGASNDGVVFKLALTGKETVLHFFAGAPNDGASPSAGLIRDSAGNLYGATFEGGDGPCNAGFGCGVVFKIDPTGKETVLHNFAGPPADGENGNDLIRDSAGNLYGTTIVGGIETGSCTDNGCGVVFKLSP